MRWSCWCQGTLHWEGSKSQASVRLHCNRRCCKVYQCAACKSRCRLCVLTVADQLFWRVAVRRTLMHFCPLLLLLGLTSEPFCQWPPVASKKAFICAHIMPNLQQAGEVQAGRQAGQWMTL